MATCPHCGASVDDSQADAFCCGGCRVAHAFLVDTGLERYYALADAPLPAGRTPSQRPWLPGVLDAAHGGRVTIDVQGVSCGACVWVIEKLGARRGIACRVNPGVGSVELALPDDHARLDALLNDVESLGYRLGPAKKHADAGADTLLVRTGICAALAMNGMVFAFSRYFGLSGADGDVATWFRAGELVLAAASVMVGGSWFFKSAGQALRRGVVHLDLPIALGIALAFGGSVLSAWLSTSDAAYFDTVSMFVALMLLGRLAQRRLLAQGRSLLLADEGLDGLFVHRLENGAPRAVPAGAVRAGDRLLVVPRELVPMAARVVEGAAPFSLAWITGESEPHTLRVGDALPAGAHHAGSRAVVVEATEDMARSGLHTLLAARAIDDPDASPFWRRYATSSVLAVLTLAGAALLFWWDAGAVRALEVTTAVLVVTCPCAIGLAVPLAVELASARLRRRGVYLRRPGVLDRLANVRHVLLDKTGTVTLAEMRLDDATRAALRALSPAHRQALYDLCARSSHPKSRAVVEALLTTPVIAPVLTAPVLTAPVLTAPVLTEGLSVEEIPGHGLVCPTASTALCADEFTVNGVVALRLSFVEVLQRDARSEVRALRARGLDVHLASGDVPERVLETAARLGLDLAPAPCHVHAGLRPEDKAALVRSLGADRVLFIGDGVNDAPAFAAAACAGTPALDRPQLPARADFVFVGKGLGPLDALFETARMLRRASLAAIAFAIAYNALVVSLALAGSMTPLACAVLMPGSSLTVIALVTLMMRERPAARVALGDAGPAGLRQAGLGEAVA